MMSLRFSSVVWLCAALTFALSIVFAGGYGIGTLLIFLASLSVLFRWLLFQCSLRRELATEDKILFGVFLLYSLGMFVFVYLDGWHIRELDRPLRFLLALPVLALLLKTSGKISWLWFGVLVGALGAFAIAVYERSVLGLWRAGGGINEIMFGNTGMMLGMISFVAAMYFMAKKQYFGLVLAIVGGVCGVGVSLLSGSRGGWVGLPLIGFFLIWQSRSLLGTKNIFVVCIMSVALLVAVVSVPQIGVQSRIMEAVQNVQQYQDGSNKNTSVGLRFEMWKASLLLFQSSPLVGVGEYGSVAVKQDLIAQGAVNPKVLYFSHSHNELVNALGLTGIIGFALLLAVYLVPLRLFLRKMREYPDNWNVRAYAMAGALIPMCYIDFGLTQVMFSHNIGVMMYAFPIVYFWAAVRWAEREELAKGERLKVE